MVRQAAERMAINTPVQGTAADIIKAAMVHIDTHLPAAVPSASMILQVHDELVFEVPVEDVDALAAFVTRAMEDVVELNVPLVANAGFGRNWLDAH